MAKHFFLFYFFCWFSVLDERLGFDSGLHPRIYPDGGEIHLASASTKHVGIQLILYLIYKKSIVGWTHTHTQGMKEKKNMERTEEGYVGS